LFAINCSLCLVEGNQYLLRAPIRLEDTEKDDSDPPTVVPIFVVQNDADFHRLRSNLRDKLDYVVHFAIQSDEPQTSKLSGIDNLSHDGGDGGGDDDGGGFNRVTQESSRCPTPFAPAASTTAGATSLDQTRHP
jgi:hypothetical protein